MILRRFLIQVEGFIPGRLTHGRKGADGDLPLGNRKSGTGQPGDTSDHHLDGNHENTKPQPVSNNVGMCKLGFVLKFDDI